MPYCCFFPNYQDANGRIYCSYLKNQDTNDTHTYNKASASVGDNEESWFWSLLRTIFVKSPKDLSNSTRPDIIEYCCDVFGAKRMTVEIFCRLVGTVLQINVLAQRLGSITRIKKFWYVIAHSIVTLSTIVPIVFDRDYVLCGSQQACQLDHSDKYYQHCPSRLKSIY